jgi:hypothetical protein
LGTRYRADGIAFGHYAAAEIWLWHRESPMASRQRKM